MQVYCPLFAFCLVLPHSEHLDDFTEHLDAFVVRLCSLRKETMP
jgi:hypothetical protein